MLRQSLYLEAWHLQRPLCQLANATGLRCMILPTASRPRPNGSSSSLVGEPYLTADEIRAWKLQHAVAQGSRRWSTTRSAVLQRTTSMTQNSKFYTARLTNMWNDTLSSADSEEVPAPHPKPTSLSALGFWDASAASGSHGLRAGLRHFLRESGMHWVEPSSSEPRGGETARNWRNPHSRMESTGHGKSLIT